MKKYSIRNTTNGYRPVYDRRNCMYWNPEFKPEKDPENNFSFFTSDTRGTYQVIVQAITKDGLKLIVADTEFIVE